MNSEAHSWKLQVCWEQKFSKYWLQTWTPIQIMAQLCDQQPQRLCRIEFTASFSHTQMAAPKFPPNDPAIHSGIYSANWKYEFPGWMTCPKPQYFIMWLYLEAGPLKQSLKFWPNMTAVFKDTKEMFTKERPCGKRQEKNDMAIYKPGRES